MSEYSAIDWSKAPEDATHAAEVRNHKVCWYKDISGGGYKYKYSTGGLLSDWGYNTGVPQHRPIEPHPRSQFTNSEHQDHKEGEGVKWEPGVDLPPEGTLVDIKGDGLVYGDGESGEVVGHFEDTAIVRISYGLGCFEARVLFPAKSHRDKVIEAAYSALDKRELGCCEWQEHARRIFEQLYAAKMLDLPKE